MKDAQLDRDEVLKDFGVKVSKSMAEIKGRVLDPPQLKCSKQVTPANGQWDIRNERFFRGISLTHWAVVVFPRDFDDKFDIV